jgi:FhuF 2Fe-2S C-terminal domain
MPTDAGLFADGVPGRGRPGAERALQQGQPGAAGRGGGARPGPSPGGAAGAVARLVGDHLAWLVARLAERRVRRGPRALWGLVANSCAAAVLAEAQAAGLPAEATGRLLGQLLDAPGRPLPAPAVLQVGPDAQPRLVRRRVTCCLNYTVAGSPCATCPLLPPAETRRRLLAPRRVEPSGSGRRG